MKLNRSMLRKLILKEILSESLIKEDYKDYRVEMPVVLAIRKAAEQVAPKNKFFAYPNQQGPDVSINIAGYISEKDAKKDLDKILNDKVNLPAELHTQFESAIIDPVMTGTGKYNIHFLIP